VSVAIRDGAKLAGDNAPVVETEKDEEALSADDIKAAKAADMTLEEYKKFMPKEGE
jgi:hypothetical protein